MKLGQNTVFESTSSMSSSPEKKKGVQISVCPVSSEDSLTMQRQSSSQNKPLNLAVGRKSIQVSQTGNSHLAVIEESHEHRSNNSQQSQHSEEELHVSPS